MGSVSGTARAPAESTKESIEESIKKSIEEPIEESIAEDSIPAGPVAESSVAESAILESSAKGLLAHPALWRAGQLHRQRPGEADTIATGFEVLDRHLPGGGWPRAGLCELMLPTAGLGELRLLLPALKALSRQARWIAWVNPPFIPYAPALAAAGIDIGRILLIHPKTHRDALWALERATRSGTCSAALAWLDERQLRTQDTRRLQMAARQGGTLSLLLRPEAARTAGSMAELRLAITPGKADGQRLDVEIRKRRGGWPVSGLSLSLVRGPRPAEIREQLSLWRQWRAAEPGFSAQQTHPAAGLHGLRPEQQATVRAASRTEDQHITH